MTHFLCKHGGQSSIPQTHLTQVWDCSENMYLWWWGDGDKEDPWACWEASLASQLCSKPMREPVSKEMDGAPENDRGGGSSPASTCAWILLHPQTHIYAHTCIHILASWMVLGKWMTKWLTPNFHSPSSVSLWGFTEGLMLVKCLARYLMIKKYLMHVVVERPVSTTYSARFWDTGMSKIRY